MSAPKPLTSEPAVAIGGSVGAIILAILGLLKAFGVDLTPEQSDSILVAVAAVSPVIAALLIRRKVWSPAGLAEVLPVHEGAGPADGDRPGEHKRED